ncbi:MAG: hypothetical protein Q4D59_11770 [Erysipelotrichaceae bacterium]|nr:hypothetical protein [Erysipelotrichaceae bacterium]
MPIKKESELPDRAETEFIVINIHIMFQIGAEVFSDTLLIHRKITDDMHAEFFPGTDLPVPAGYI